MSDKKSKLMISRSIWSMHKNAACNGDGDDLRRCFTEKESGNMGCLQQRGQQHERSVWIV